MKHFVCKISAAVIVMIAISSAAFCGLNVDVNIGIPLPSIIISEPPEFILPPSLGFYVAVGTDYDLYQVDNDYFIYRDHRWFKGPYYDGPWREVRYKRLPRALRRHNHDQIRYYRDREYRHYRNDNHRYKQRNKHRYFRPENRHGRHNDRHNDRNNNRHDDRHNNRHDDKHNDNQGDRNPWKENRGH